MCNVEALRDVAGQVPAEIVSAVTRRCSIDLESLTKGRARFYFDGDEPETVLLGFTYSAVGQMGEWKRYRRDPDCKQRLLIDRFEAMGEAKSIGEVERAGSPALWKGPRDLPRKALQAGLYIIHLSKVAKNQSHLRILSSSI